MSWVRLSLELVTPCFLGGAAGASASIEEMQDEGLRPASLIGQWRFWLRAALAASRPDWMAREAELFGSVRAGSVGQGRVCVRQRFRPSVVVPCGQRIEELTQRTGYMRFEEGNSSIDPVAYLLGQGFYHFSRGLERLAFQAGQSFDIEVTVRGQRNDATAWKDLRHALWLWQTFGGLGARSRRGWGSLQIGRLDNLEVIPPQERSAWQEWFPGAVPWTEQKRDAVLTRLLDVAGHPATPGQVRGPLAFTGAGTDPEQPDACTTKDQTPFSHLGRCCAIVPLANDDAIHWSAALADFGVAMLMIRSNVYGRDRPANQLRVRDHDAVHAQLYNRRPLRQAPYRSAFGLPHNYFFPEKSGRARRFAQFEGALRGATRRASPVLLHVARMTDSRRRPVFVPLVLWFKARLTKASVREARSRDAIQPPDWTAVVAFLREFYDSDGSNQGEI